VAGPAADHDPDSPPQAVLIVRTHFAPVRGHQSDGATRDHVRDHSVTGPAGERDCFHVAVAHDDPVTVAGNGERGA